MIFCRPSIEIGNKKRHIVLGGGQSPLRGISTRGDVEVFFVPPDFNAGVGDFNAGGQINAFSRKVP